MAVDRVRRVSNKKEANSVIDDYMSMGYRIQNEGDTSILLRKRNIGSIGWHLLVFILTAWWTFLLGNVIFALIAYFAMGDKIIVKITQEEP